MRQVSPRFAVNHMAAPPLDVSAFFALARDQGLTDVQIRDLHFSNPVACAIPAADVRSAATEAGVTIISVNALQRFNDWTPTRQSAAIKLADYAAACGAKTVVLEPVNDGSWACNGERHDSLRVALNALKPILQPRGLIGLIEPLGFRTCSLRSKKQAAEAIAAVDGQSVFRLVHDTFHHTLAGETFLFSELTGLVHISGVNDPTFWIYPDRFLGGSDNGSQIQALLDGGYEGPFSFELIEVVRTLDDLAGALAASIDFIQRRLLTPD
ncbi:TIM barrel protein (plasmid) [Mesorhizobium sp. AR02]|uniref:TIM barrel protein n=1 Tax=Mesorhizobium huakuii TaxID=28104 RepID=A0A7G6T5G6_9HYPH|nr:MULTISPECIES: TIM barrel protein [Mesorhizobium]QND61998.1 TIM barrel protein [Mesorhizobium huakuii]QND69369.1 TIM barrel protein [Mesorhizobium loti]UVK35569.1 TIM barrel protein [Mesorhizobium sp. AR10]UVK50122.1 TIM barrel protein [Mesorhizobium sp. AR02]